MATMKETQLDIEKYTHETFEGQAKMIIGYLHDIGLQVGGNCTLRIEQHSEDWRGNSTQGIEVDIDYKKLTEPRRRDLKRAVALEVPSYALGGTYKEPPLHGELEFRTPEEDHEFILTIQFMVSGAYVCKAVGKRIEPANTWDLKRAEELESMTPEQILAEHREKAAKLRQPREREAYECAPSK
jgi:hypothetical protein